MKIKATVKRINYSLALIVKKKELYREQVEKLEANLDKEIEIQI